jgi:hypothetical protein
MQKYQKSLTLKLIKIIDFLINKFKKSEFFIHPQKWVFLQKLQKNFQFQNFLHRIFFTKYKPNTVMKTVQKHYFCSKNDQIMSMPNMRI